MRRVRLSPIAMNRFTHTQATKEQRIHAERSVRLDIMGEVSINAYCDAVISATWGLPS